MPHLGYFVAVGGGLVAQTPEPIVSYCGLVVGIAGLIAGAFKTWLDFRLAMRRMDDQEAKLIATQRELAEARERNHQRDNRTAGVLNTVQAQVHANTAAIDQHTIASKVLAEKTGVEVPLPPPVGPYDPVLTESP